MIQMVIEIYAGECRILEESLEVRLASMRGDFPFVFDRLPALYKNEDWNLCIDAVCQLLALHTVDSVDGVTKVLYDPWNATLKSINKVAKQVDSIKKLSGRQYLSVEASGLRDAITSLRLLLNLRSGMLDYFFQIAPFDYNNQYTQLGLDDWMITRRQVTRLIDPLIYQETDFAYIATHTRLLQRLSTIYEENVKKPVNRTPAS